MIPRKAIWLLGPLLAIAALSSIFPIAEAQEGTRVTMGPWRAVENADEVTVYLTLPPDYVIDESKVGISGPELKAHGPPATEEQAPPRQMVHEYEQPALIDAAFWSNENNLSLQGLMQAFIQDWNVVEGFRLEVKEQGPTKISGHDAYYAFIDDICTLGDYDSIQHRLTVFIKIDDYHSSLPGNTAYLRVGGNCGDWVYTSSAPPLIHEVIGGADASDKLNTDLHSIFDSLQLEVGAAPAEGGGIPIVWIVIPVVCVVAVIGVMLLIRLH